MCRKVRADTSSLSFILLSLRAFYSYKGFWALRDEPQSLQMISAQLIQPTLDKVVPNIQVILTATYRRIIKWQFNYNQMLVLTQQTKG